MNYFTGSYACYAKLGPVLHKIHFICKSLDFIEVYIFTRFFARDRIRYFFHFSLVFSQNGKVFVGGIQRLDCFPYSEKTITLISSSD
jgi:hypothetical protein